MAQSLEINQLLSFTSQPAFCVENSVVREVNPSAQNRGISPKTPIQTLLRSGQEDYETFHDGRLFLTVGVGEQTWDACVHCMGSLHIFVLEHDERQPELRALSLAASQFREPLAGVISTSDNLLNRLGQDDPEIREYAALMTRRLYQLQRLVGNMSDTARYRSEVSVRLETADVAAFVDEVFEKAACLVSQSGIELTYESQCADVLCLLDREKLERAVFNMLSNAIKFGGRKIHAKFFRKGNRLYLTVSDDGSGIPQQVCSTVYTRYLRQPELEDRLWGIGLGMSLICSAARIHGGTVLLEQPESGGTRITMAFPIRQSKGMLHNRAPKVDYAGERDHALMELSEVLPPSLYEN